MPDLNKCWWDIMSKWSVCWTNSLFGFLMKIFLFKHTAHGYSKSSTETPNRFMVWLYLPRKGNPWGCLCIWSTNSANCACTERDGSFSRDTKLRPTGSLALWEISTLAEFLQFQIAFLAFYKMIDGKSLFLWLSKSLRICINYYHWRLKAKSISGWKHSMW